MAHNIIDIPLDQYTMHNTRCSRKHNSQFLQIRHLTRPTHSEIVLSQLQLNNVTIYCQTLFQATQIVILKKVNKYLIDPLANMRSIVHTDVMCRKGIICQYVNRNRDTAHCL